MLSEPLTMLVYKESTFDIWRYSKLCSVFAEHICFQNDLKFSSENLFSFSKHLYSYQLHKALGIFEILFRLLEARIGAKIGNSFI